MRPAFVASLALCVATAAAGNINDTFAALQASFSSEVKAVVEDVLFSTFSDVGLTFTSQPVQAHGVCNGASSDVTSFLSDMNSYVVFGDTGARGWRVPVVPAL
jgi:hypothetical protein